MSSDGTHGAIARLLAAYADTMNRRAWRELGELFLPDARIELTPLARPPLVLAGPDALGRFIADATARFDFFQFVQLNARIELHAEPQSAGGRIYLCEHRRERASAGWTQVFGVYHDRYRQVDGRWWFAERVFHPLASQGSENVVFEVPASLAARLDGPL